ncbi:hypothetical protein AAG906_002798 [Vitis piasezkii]
MPWKKAIEGWCKEEMHSLSALQRLIQKATSDCTLLKKLVISPWPNVKSLPTVACLSLKALQEVEHQQFE